MLEAPEPGLEMAHVPVTRRAALAADGTSRVSWPEQAAKVDTDVTEDVMRTVALPAGFVDVTVCAIDAVWSGLALVVRNDLH